MAKSLLIVESPAKAKTLQKYLGKDFDVRASVGHIRDLPKKELGVDVDHNFNPKYVTIEGKTKTIQDLRKAAINIQDVYLGPDPDREGEAIAWHIAEVLNSGKHSFHRVLFYELTPKAIKEALAKPVALNRPRYEAQQARRILDRLVGYQISPLLWEKVKRGLSAGRVQSVALRLICDREKEILEFVSQEYWSLTAHLKASQPPPFIAKLIKHKSKKIELANGDQTQKVVSDLTGAQYQVAKVDQKERQKKPLPPFITSTMQQEGSRKLRFGAQRTMRLAQGLYEGKDLGAEGPVGLITYMRTDSTRVAGVALSALRDFIGQEYGPDYLPAKPHAYKSRKSAQEAHEAIRPTDVTRTPASLKNFLDKDELRLYELIWKRFVASQMEPARLLITTADIGANDYIFRATGSVVKFPGFTILYEESPDAVAEDDDVKLPPLTVGEILDLLKLEPKQHFTQPPPRYTEATLIKELERLGIGRPSTYATILTVILGRLYVAKIKAGFKPTELGMMINDLLVASFPNIMDVGFTANLEERLDSIAAGSVVWQDVLQDFYGSFVQELEEAKGAMPTMKGKGLATGLTCPDCGGDLVIKWGKNGEFLGCANYPECRYTSNFSRNDQGEIVPQDKTETPAVDLPEVTEPCPKCGKTLVAKQGRFGLFLACPGYPKCRFTRSLQEESEQPAGVPCPEKGCDGTILPRRSRRGVFYGCSNYPKCKFTLNYPPVAKSCPKCGYPLLIAKETKKLGKFLACPQKACDFTEPLTAEGSA
jgi:DNA topoisomerase I